MDAQKPGKGSCPMENPVINTWRQGTRLVESSSRMIDQRFPIACDTIIPAVGQVCVVDCVLPDEDNLTSWKSLVVDRTTFQSDRKYIFGGGDCVTGPDTLIGALAAGKHAARFIMQYLQHGRCTPQTTDMLRALVTSGGFFDDDEACGYSGNAPRLDPDIMDPQSRVQSFAEVEKGFSAAQARTEAARCLRCYRILLAAV
jgi:formate dehydrogenase (NADP+) beta subunit